LNSFSIAIILVEGGERWRIMDDPPARARGPRGTARRVLEALRNLFMNYPTPLRQCQTDPIQPNVSLEAASLSAIWSIQVQYTFKITVKLRVIHGQIQCYDVKPSRYYNLAFIAEILFGRFYPSELLLSG
jgi:hypothetical protein